MELLLWRWSTIVQVSSDLMIALFFITLALSTRRVELRPWVQAWLMNLAALAVAVLYWLWQPQTRLWFAVVLFLYVFCKTLFVLLLLLGTRQFLPTRRWRLNPRQAVLVSAGLGFAGAVLIPNIDWLGTVQASVIAIGLGYGAWLALRHRITALAWIAVGFAARATLALVETAAYVLSNQMPDGGGDPVRIYLAAHSSFDSAAEWVIALGCVLALYRTIQQELTQTCSHLLSVKEELQTLVDSDALTGLGNRRTLRQVLASARDTGASIVFFDLDNFKQINDEYGHQIGDDCLKDFASALQHSFRPTDHIIRYAGDEFVVVAPGVTPEALQDRINTTRQQLSRHHRRGPRIRFSVGTSYLDVGGEPEAALHAADAAMYSQKKA
ncbi:GGDEF domain-containing protein [Permianibacter sp. IMCC34836]|uniref:GGDEF domain-containing protein n=1 Tax=Permianibacter fluminis TaxID=2738515 RepID=UPI0015546509|nr:GGDEF domain-containing protein [Permianibacter fluminis]NQD35898.1 GGDEF domain-containing protein [Permianibacter fluminis]